MFLRMMLIQLGLIRVEEFSLRAVPGEAFFGAPPLERIRRTFEAYVTGRQLNELALQHAISTYGETPGAGSRPAGGCAQGPGAVLSPGSTLDRPGGVDRARPRNGLRIPAAAHFPHQPTARVTITPPSIPTASSATRWAGTGRFLPALDEGEGWRRVEGQWIRWMVSAAFFWMGLVDLGYHDLKGVEPDCFFLTAPGRWLLAGGAAPEIPQEGGQVIVQPDYTLLAFDPISDAVLFHLEQFATGEFRPNAPPCSACPGPRCMPGSKPAGSADRIQSYLEELSSPTAAGQYRPHAAGMADGPRTDQHYDACQSAACPAR